MMNHRHPTVLCTKSRVVLALAALASHGCARGSSATPTIARAAGASPSADAAAVRDGAVARQACRSGLAALPAPAVTNAFWPPPKPFPDDRPRLPTIPSLGGAPELARAPSLLRTCARLADSARRRLAGPLRPLGDADVRAQLQALTVCLAAGDEAWTFEVTSALPSTQRPSVEGDRGPEVAVTARPVRVRADGSTAPGPAALHLVLGTRRFAQYVSLTRFIVFDWDGDGRGELSFEEVHEAEEGMDGARVANRYWMFTATPSAVREFGDLGPQTDEVRDVDGDGRPDVIVKSPWFSQAGTCGINGDVFLSGPLLLRHALPGGVFSGDDAVAQSFLAEQCRDRPPPLRIAGDEARLASPLVRVGCARFWGLSAAETVRAIEAATVPPSNDQAAAIEGWGCHPPSELVRVAALDPPASFRLRCE